MLSVKKLIESAKACLGWPYKSPGTNNKNGIDCSGLFVKCFKDQGAKIYHGSNTIFRNYCSETGKLTSESQLKPGMAVFKLKAWTDSETDKKNSWYGKEPGNLSHIGMVTGVNPLEITHASTGTMCVTTDTKIGTWAYWGKLKNVDYGSDSGTSGGGGSRPAETPAASSGMAATVYAKSGDTVFLRQKASQSCRQWIRVPIGAQVTVTTYKQNWCTVNYGSKKGWFMMTQFLKFD